jgi:hypothetical protein
MNMPATARTGTCSSVDDITWDQGLALMQQSEAAFASGNIESILAMFNEDVVVLYSDFSEIRGIAAYRRFAEARIARQRNYHTRKTLRVVRGNLIGDTWEGWWDDAVSGRAMQGRGAEFLYMRNGRISELVANFNVWPVGAGSATPIV